MARLIGWILMLATSLGGVGDWNGFRFPTIGWLFETTREIGWAMAKADWYPGGEVPWLGWLMNIGLWMLGAWLVASFSGRTNFSPLMLRRMQRFREIKRGYWSLVILLVLALLAALDFVIVGSQALAVRYDGKWTFPAFTRTIEKGADFGLKGEKAKLPVDYRELRKDWKEKGKKGTVVLPLWPYEPTGESITALSSPLQEKENGRIFKGRQPYNGYASHIYDADQPEARHLSFRFRDGVKDGRAEGWEENGDRVYGATYRKGNLVPGSEQWWGEGDKDEFLKKTNSGLVQVHFQPSPPMREHWLGTTAQGYDVIAYLYGGLQANFQAAAVYVPLVYLIGITVGLLMGYFGGTFDLLVQRLIEILSNIPFLFVVMIVSVSIPPAAKEKWGLWMIVLILVAFGWMGMTYLMRTAALKEKARDYIASARVIGASTPQILFKHLLPNSVAIVVTLVPFSISGLILSLASLDYLGFGVPPQYATWGKLLREGLENLSAGWLVTSGFLALVGLLVLVTFVGEAVREAFDPKKFSYYR